MKAVKAPKTIPLADYLTDKNLLGGLSAFRAPSSWTRWRVLLTAIEGLPLDDAEQAIFRHHTGRSVYAPPLGGWKEVVVVTGRQSGKSRIAAAIATAESVRAAQTHDGDAYALLVAQDHRGAMRTLYRYATSPFKRVPMLAPLVGTRTLDTLALTNGVTLAAYPCRPAAVRGLRAVVAVCDELAFFRSAEGNPVDTEMLRALRPTLATTGGRLIILSSPYAQAGALWDLDRRYFATDNAAVLVWHGTAPEMNPLLPRDYLARMEQDDPEAYRSEVLGEFRAGITSLFDPAALDACVAEDVRERAPVAGVNYVAFADPSGGRRDKFTVALAHLDGDRAVLDVARAWAPPFNPSGVVAEVCDLLASYHVTEVVGDRYSAEFVAEAFRANKITYTASERDRSAIYLEMLPLMNAGRTVLLDLPDLLRELRMLERRRGLSGRDRVDHIRGGHDDQANSAAGALVLVSAPEEPPIQIWGGGSPSLPVAPLSPEELAKREEAAAQREEERRQRSAKSVADAVRTQGFYWPS